MGDLFNCTISGENGTSSTNCYNTAIDASQIVTGIYINISIGLLCYAGFVLWRGSFRIYFNRLLTPQLKPSQRPPPLKLGGHWQLWSWLIPVFKVSDGALLESAGLDALMAQRILGFGCLMLLPLTVLGIGVLLPVNYTSYEPPPETSNTTSINDEFLKMTMSAVPTGSGLLWIHFTFTYIFIAWVCFLLVQYYKEFISLRQEHDAKQLQGTELGKRNSLLEDKPHSGTAEQIVAQLRLQTRKSSVTPLGDSSGGGDMFAAGLPPASGSRHTSVHFSDGVPAGQGATELVLHTGNGDGGHSSSNGGGGSRVTVELIPRSSSFQHAGKPTGQAGGSGSSAVGGGGGSGLHSTSDVGLRQRYSSPHPEDLQVAENGGGSSPASLSPTQQQQAATGVRASAGSLTHHKNSDAEQQERLDERPLFHLTSDVSNEAAALSPFQSHLHPSPFDVSLDLEGQGGRQVGAAHWDELAQPLPLVQIADAAQFYTVLVVDEAVEEFVYRHVDSPWIWHMPGKMAGTPKAGKHAFGAMVSEGKALARLNSTKRRQHLVHCNRRMEVAEEAYRAIFGDDFDRIVPVYDTQKLDELLMPWYNQRLLLDRLLLQQQQLAERQRKLEEKQQQQQKGVEGQQRQAGGGGGGDKAVAKAAAKQQKQTQQLEKQQEKLVQRIDKTEHKLAELQGKYEEAQQEAAEALPAPCFFATFRSAQAAAYAARLNLNPNHERMMRVMPAPAPNNVNYTTMMRGWAHRGTRPVIVYIFVLAMLIFPIGIFVGICGTLVSAICGDVPDGSVQAISANKTWFCSDDKFAAFFRSVITGILPSILLSVWQAVVLPIWFYTCAQAEAQHFSLSSLDLRCASWFFLHDLFNVFLGGMLGGSVLWGLKAVINEPGQFFVILGQAVPASSNFFINYISYRGLAMAAFRLFFPHAAVFGHILKWLHILPKPQTDRDKEAETPPRNCRYSRDLGVLQMTVFVVTLGYAVVSPLILPFGLVYFLLTWPVWRYQMLYVYQGNYDNHGQFWVYTAHRLVICLGVMASFTAAVLAVKGAYTQGLVLVITAVVFLVWFDRYLTMRYDAVVDQLPAVGIHRAPRARVDDCVYLQPPMRPKAAGWYPEWGKAWLGYGAPRYGP